MFFIFFVKPSYAVFFFFFDKVMALIQEGRSEYDVHAWSEFDIFKAIAYVDSRFKFDNFS